MIGLSHLHGRQVRFLAPGLGPCPAPDHCEPLASEPADGRALSLCHTTLLLGRPGAGTQAVYPFSSSRKAWWHRCFVTNPSCPERVERSSLRPSTLLRSLLLCFCNPCSRRSKTRPRLLSVVTSLSINTRDGNGTAGEQFSETSFHKQRGTAQWGIGSIVILKRITENIYYQCP